MKKLLIVLSLIPFCASATITDHGTFIHDDTTGLYWLKLTETRGMGYEEIEEQMALGQPLRVWRFVNGALVDVTSLAGLTNHRIGEDFISSGIRDCGTGPEMITAHARWQNLQVTRLADERLTTEPLTRFSQAALREALDCR